MAFIGKTPTPVPLTSSDIPDLPATKITSGTFPALNGSNLTGISAGKILQVKSAVNTSASATSTSGFTDFPSLSVSITPTASSNKFLIQYHVYLTLLNVAGFTRIMRDSTAVGIGDSAGSRLQTTSNHMNKHTDANHGYHGFYGQFLDSPSTSSAITYKLQLATQGDVTAYINRSQNDTDTSVYGSRSISTFNVYEVEST